MSITIGVALITSISTLSGGLIASLVGLKVQKRQIIAQATLAASEREEQRLLRDADSRRQTYIQFLNQVNDVERLLQKCWEERVPGITDYTSETLEKAWEGAKDLERAANMVALEGPTEVDELARSLYGDIFEEIDSITDAILTSIGNGKTVSDAAPGKRAEHLRSRKHMKSEFISMARKATRADP